MLSPCVCYAMSGTELCYAAACAVRYPVLIYMCCAMSGTKRGDAGTERGDAGTGRGDAGTERGDAGTERGDA
eukprot:1826900-Rhodomonas_salina.3